MGLNKRTRLIAGVGVNDADYVVSRHEIINGKRKRVWLCPFYETWKHVLERCYSSSYHKTHPTYIGCEACVDWHTFSNFKAWMETQDWEGKQLDKDLLFEGNRLYSPNTCIFVDSKINNFVLDNASSRGDYMLGVYWQNDRGRFQSSCRNPINGKKEFLGRFTNELQAHLAWKTRKHELACELADSELVSDPRLKEALKTRYL